MCAHNMCTCRNKKKISVHINSKIKVGIKIGIHFAGDITKEL